MATHNISSAFAKQKQRHLSPHTAPPDTFHIQGLASALERYDEGLKKLFQNLEILNHKHDAGKNDIEAIYLNAIEKVSRCSVIALYKDRCITQTCGESSERKKFLTLFRQAFEQKTRAHGSAPDAHLITKENEDAFELAILPMLQDSSSGIAILRHPDSGLEIDEVIYFTLRKIYTLSDSFSKVISVDVLKSNVFDLLKQRYQYVSEYVYEERFSLFRTALESVQMHFEPIYNFDNMHQSEMIYSWEALARVGDDNRAPVDILNAAELWGTRFKTELDIYVLEKSITTYCEKTQKAKISSQNAIRPLSINIYPDTLFRPAYHDKLEELLKGKKLIRGSNLVLEVSEKSIIDESDNSGNGDTIQKFLAHMEDLRKKYNIAFAIDDFGAGYSSIVRLNKLKPEWVKIDREVLHCEPKFAKSLIKNLLSIKTEWERPAFRVIIEGLDTDSKIGLDELLQEVGVEYIQGYLLGRAQPDIVERPDDKLSEAIRSSAGWLATPLPLEK